MKKLRKLAKKAGVPVVPLALKTDGWGNGRRFKDFGRINTNKKAYFAFGEPIVIEGKGDLEQEQINEFISTKLNPLSQNSGMQETIDNDR